MRSIVPECIRILPFYPGCLIAYIHNCILKSVDGTSNGSGCIQRTGGRWKARMSQTVKKTLMLQEEIGISLVCGHVPPM